MTISSGDKAIMLNSADGTQTPYFMSSNIASGDKFILTQTADGALVPMNVSTDVANSDKCFMAMTADSKGVLVKGESIPLFWVTINSSASASVVNTGTPNPGLFAVQQSTGISMEGFINLPRTITSGRENVLSLRQIIIKGECPFSAATQSSTLNSCRLRIYILPTSVDLGNLTWANKPSGILLETREYTGWWNSAAHSALRARIADGMEDSSFTIVQHNMWRIAHETLDIAAVRVVIDNVVWSGCASVNSWEAGIGNGLFYILSKEIT